MSTPKQKFLSILLEECQSVEEKCDGYPVELEKAIVEIIRAERQHSVIGTNINQKVEAICEKAGNYLYAKRQDSTSDSRRRI